MQRRLLFVFTTVLALGWGSASAHDGASGIVKERMDQMKGFAAASKKIKSELSKGAAYDPVVVSAEAVRIARHAGAKLTKFYPQGSLHAPSEASAAIWQNNTDFEAAAQQLVERALALGNAPTSESATTAFAALLQNCAACHQHFRQKRK